MSQMATATTPSVTPIHCKATPYVCTGERVEIYAAVLARGGIAHVEGFK
jgi:hypothetical protein